MKQFILFFILASAHAFDSDQKIDKCGQYQVFAKLNCQGAQGCELILGESKLSKFKIKLSEGQYSLNYFSGRDIKMDIEVESIGDEILAKALSSPIQQVSAIKKEGFTLKKEMSCK